MNEPEAKIAVFSAQEPMATVQSLKEQSHALDKPVFGIVVMMKMHFHVGDSAFAKAGELVESARIVLLRRIEERV